MKSKDSPRAAKKTGKGGQNLCYDNELMTSQSSHRQQSDFLSTSPSISSTKINGPDFDKVSVARSVQEMRPDIPGPYRLFDTLSKAPSAITTSSTKINASNVAPISHSASFRGVAQPGSEARKVDLPLPEYDRWYEILRADNVDQYETLLATFNMVQRKEFVNGTFSYPNNMWNKAKQVKYGYKGCFVLAVAFGSVGCASRMLLDGADITARDPTNSDNWVHALIEAAALTREKESKFVDLFRRITETLSRKTRKKLLYMENAEGFRPLELSAKRGVYRILRAILDTKGVYVERIGRRGLNTYLKYSLQEYMVGLGERERYMRSPLRLVNYVKFDELESLQDSGFTTMPLVEKWMKDKYRTSILWVIIWTIFRLALLIALFYFDPTQGSDPNAETPVTRANVTEPLHRSDAIEKRTYNIILITIGTIGGVIAVADIISALVQLFDPLRRRVYGLDILCLSDYVSKTAFYRINQFLLSVFTVVGFTLSGAFFLAEFGLYLKCLILPVTIFSGMFLLELVPYIGFFSIAMQQMTVIMFKFLAVVTGMNVIFASFFHDVVHKTPDSRFTDMSESHYSTFLLMQSEFAFGSNPPPAIQMAHIFFYYMTVVLLLNYLIAVLSEALTVLSSAKREMLFLRRLDVVITVEDRIHCWLYRYFNACRCCRVDDEMVVCVRNENSII